MEEYLRGEFLLEEPIHNLVNLYSYVGEQPLIREFWQRFKMETYYKGQICWRRKPELYRVEDFDGNSYWGLSARYSVGSFNKKQVRLARV